MANSISFQALGLASLFLPSAPGVYALSRDGRTVHYIGRSDTDLSSRVLSSASEGGGYRYYWALKAPNATQAYRWECDLFHQYTGLDNRIHPDAPAFSGLACHHPGCSSMTLAQALGLLFTQNQRRVP
jgi:hypothetical protein